jgi:hypothetical protein
MYHSHTQHIFPFPYPKNSFKSAFKTLNALATVGAQIALIAGSKPQYSRSDLLQGPAHSDKCKGMPVTDPNTGQVQAYLEGGEGITKNLQCEANNVTR